MPVLTGPSCLTSVDCPEVIFPTTPAVCSCETAKGGVNDLYFIPCSEELTAVNITDIAWWNTLLTGNKLSRIGLGIGSITRKADKKEKISSERKEQTVMITWALKYIIKCFDKTSADTTVEQMNALIKHFNKFLVVARMSDGDETILPIGVFTTSDFNWNVPENSDDIQNVEVELSWDELGLPRQYRIAGLSAVLPKAA